MPKITFSLNTASLDNAIEQLNAYQKKVETLGEKTTEKLTEMGERTAIEYALYMDAYDTGWLVSSIISETKGTNGRVLATAPHAAFVEFGTGIVGRDEPHPEAFVQGWVYDKNQHGEYGWYYLAKDGHVYHTTGMPSRPFMYYTSRDLRDEAPQVAREILQGGGDE